MTKETPSKPHPWKVFGYCFNKAKADHPKDHWITLPQQQSNLGMRTRTAKPVPPTSAIASENFGYPMNAKQAVYFIGKALTATNELFDVLFKNKRSNSLTKDQNEFLKAAIGLPYGITFDKSIILKILSQPNCEGVRSYLCKRDSGHISLVLVGVDIDGYDLNYYFESTKKNMDDPNIDDDSLCAEYGHPPDGMTYQEKSFDEHYVLLNYARP